MSVSNTARRRATRCIVNSVGASREPSLWLPFLYPAFHYSSRRRGLETSSTSQAYFNDNKNNSSNEPQSAAEAESDPWGYLYGEPVIEEAKIERRTSDENRYFRSSFDFRSNQEIPPGFEKNQRGSAPRSRLYNMQQDSGDLTMREYALFERIFNDLLRTHSATPRKAPPSKDHHPGPTLSALFESALGPQRYNEELSFGPERTLHNPNDITAAMARASATSHFPPSLRAAAAHVAGLPRAGMTEAEKASESERQEELQVLLRQLDTCNSDLEVWQFLETHVYNLAAPSSSDNDFNIPPANYPDLIHASMVLLRTAFSDFPGVVSVFERVKKLGAESYVVGCSVAVYNEMIKARWGGFRDLQRVNELLDEMRVNGINGNHETFAVVNDIMHEVGVLRVSPQLMGAGLLWADEETEARLDKLKESLAALTLA